MCEKAEEIQKLKPKGIWRLHSEHRNDPNKLDDKDYLYVSFYYLPNVLKERNIQLLKWDNDEGHPIIGSYSDNTEGAIWLPTQGQLQGMIFKESDFYDNISNFYCFLCEEYTYFTILNTKEEKLKYKNMNELWLCYVMREKYNKIWDSKKWVKSNDRKNI